MIELDNVLIVDRETKAQCYANVVIWDDLSMAINGCNIHHADYAVILYGHSGMSPFAYQSNPINARHKAYKDCPREEFHAIAKRIEDRLQNDAQTRISVVLSAIRVKSDELHALIELASKIASGNA